MERCKPRQLHHGHRDSHATLLLLVFLWLTITDSPLRGVRSDAANLLRGGTFADNPVQFGVFPILDVLLHGLHTQIPYWTCVHGGVQMWDASVYLPPPGSNATFILHLNSFAGGGHVVSTPMYTPRRYAEYVVSLSMACNPHGGPRNQSLMAVVFDHKGKEVEPRGEPMVVVSNATSSVENLNWEQRYFKMLGTGRCMYLYLMSMVKGYYGALVADVQVNLANLVENGSFETLKLEAGKEEFNAFTKDVTLVAPRPRSIPGWNVDSGKVKVIMTGLGKIYQSSTDRSQYALELNAENLNSEISATFEVPYNASNSQNRKYVLLFDTAANSRRLGPQSQSNNDSLYAILGKLEVKIVGMPSNEQLLNEEYESNSSGFTPRSVGWMTVNYSFRIGDDRTAKLSFRSLVEGRSFGPFVDNVVVYEVNCHAKKQRLRRQTELAVTTTALMLFLL